MRRVFQIALDYETSFGLDLPQKQQMEEAILVNAMSGEPTFDFVVVSTRFHCTLASSGRDHPRQSVCRGPGEAIPRCRQILRIAVRGYDRWDPGRGCRSDETNRKILRSEGAAHMRSYSGSINASWGRRRSGRATFFGWLALFYRAGTSLPLTTSLDQAQTNR